MRFEYILLISTFILPVIYKLGFWQDVFMSQDNDMRKFGNFLKTQKGREELIHFWIFLEIPLLCMSVLPFFNAPFEILLFGIMFYFALLYNVFVLGKVLRKKMKYPRLNLILLLTLIFIVFDGICSYLASEKYLYVFLMSLMVFMPLYFIAGIFVKNIVNKSIYKK